MKIIAVTLRCWTRLGLSVKGAERSVVGLWVCQRYGRSRSGMWCAFVFASSVGLATAEVQV